MKCPNCGAEWVGERKTCEFCGTQITYDMQRKQEQLNKKGCPQCGSSNITFTRENQGEIRGRKSRKVVHTTIGYCKDCGYTWMPETEKPKKRRTFLWLLGWLFIFPLPLTILMLRKKNLKPAIKYGVITAAWVIYLVLILVSRSNNTKKQTDTETTRPSVQSEIKEESSAAKQENSVKEESSEERIEESVEESSEEASEEETSEESEESETIDQSLIRDDVKAAIDSYEAFIDEYCEFMESYDASDMTMLAKHAELLQKEVEMTTKFDAISDQDLTEAEILYYTEVSLRCSQKMLTVTIQ